MTDFDDLYKVRLSAKTQAKVEEAKNEISKKKS